eukprot:PhM_4_TR17953/c0_g1_i1/m.39072
MNFFRPDIPVLAQQLRQRLQSYKTAVSLAVASPPGNTNNNNNNNSSPKDPEKTDADLLDTTLQHLVAHASKSEGVRKIIKLSPCVISDLVDVLLKEYAGGHVNIVTTAATLLASLTCEISALKLIVEDSNGISVLFSVFTLVVEHDGGGEKTEKAATFFLAALTNIALSAGQVHIRSPFLSDGQLHFLNDLLVGPYRGSVVVAEEWCRCIEACSRSVRGFVDAFMTEQFCGFQRVTEVMEENGHCAAVAERGWKCLAVLARV